MLGREQPGRESAVPSSLRVVVIAAGAGRPLPVQSRAAYCRSSSAVTGCLLREA
ncbi:MAG: hypothetical protein AW08_00463 [Candidatus Accumulibacter adjunctus]|uniref:Uncharacterized protein n=1 Tax=Candidatus Accumulibacter adjunctus TaxID=1454001 RepID=A0A011NX95_9PROT|nr:MAG: hypothetical protein AW08_00463 [Candidatus Accumulibacter adjunctus]